MPGSTALPPAPTRAPRRRLILGGAVALALVVWLAPKVPVAGRAGVAAGRHAGGCRRPEAGGRRRAPRRVDRHRDRRPPRAGRRTTAPGAPSARGRERGRTRRPRHGDRRKGPRDRQAHDHRRQGRQDGHRDRRPGRWRVRLLRPAAAHPARARGHDHRRRRGGLPVAGARDRADPRLPDAQGAHAERDDAAGWPKRAWCRPARRSRRSRPASCRPSSARTAQPPRRPSGCERSASVPRGPTCARAW